MFYAKAITSSASQALTARSQNLLNMIRISDPHHSTLYQGWELDLEKLAHPLYYTALEGALQLTDFLIKNGAEVNECSAGDEYETAIKTASFSGHEKIVQLLIGKGANVNAKGGMYGTALHAAAGRGSEKIVQFLFDNGSDINAQGGEYGNAIQAAVANNQTNIAHLLLLRGAKSDSPVEQWDEMVKRLVMEEGT